MCSRCTRDSRECKYDAAPSETKTAATKRRHEELQERVSELEILPTLLLTRSLGETTEIVRGLRSGQSSTDATLRDVRDAHLLLQWSETPDTAVESQSSVAGRAADQASASREPIPGQEWSHGRRAFDRMLSSGSGGLSVAENFETVLMVSNRNLQAGTS